MKPYLFHLNSFLKADQHFPILDFLFLNHFYSFYINNESKFHNLRMNCFHSAWIGASGTDIDAAKDAAGAAGRAMRKAKTSVRTAEQQRINI